MSDTDMRHDSDRWRDTNAFRVAAWALFGFAALVGGVTFVLSFHGLNDYGHVVAALGRLSWLVPLGVDGLTLTAIAATFLLTRAAFRVRLYAWSVFAFANACSVAGNLSHAHARHLAWDGAVGAAAWPILLTLASHLAIVTRRALGRHGQHAGSDIGGATGVEDVAPEPAPTADIVAPTTAPTVPADNPDSAPTTTPTTSPRVAPARRKPAPKRQPRARNLSDNDLAKHTARRRVTAGESCATVARDVGVAAKTVERWTTDIRQARDTATGDTEATA